MIHGPVNFDWWDVSATERGFFFDAGEKEQDVTIPDYVAAKVLYSDIAANAAYKWILHGSSVISALQGYRLVKTEKSGQLQRRFYFMATRTAEQRAVAIKPAV